MATIKRKTKVLFFHLLSLQYVDIMHIESIQLHVKIYAYENAQYMFSIG